MTDSDILKRLQGRSESVSRRKLLAAGSAGLAGGLAGCGGGDSAETESPTDGMGQTDSPSPTEGKGEVKEARVDKPFGTAPTNITIGWGGNGNAITNWITSALGTMKVDGSYEKAAMQEWSLEGKTLTIKIKDGYTYHDGSPMDIKDAILGHQLVYWLAPDSARWAEPPERIDRRTARFIYPEKKAETIIIRYFSQGATGALPRRFLKKSQTYIDIVQAMKEANTEDERNNIIENRVKGVPEEHKIKHVVENQRGSGTYMIESMDDVTEEYVHMVRYDDHPAVDEDFPPEFRLNFAGGSSARNQMITNDVTDFGGGAFPDKLRSAAPDHLQTITLAPKPQGTACHFNFNDKDLGNRNVRRALYTALNMPDIVKSEANKVLPHTYQLGMTESLSDNFLGSDFVSNRIEYPHEADEEAAASYMDKAGYSKSNGKWVDPDGEETDITLVAHSNKAVVAKSIADPLNNFGFNVEALTMGNPNYNNRVRTEKDYDMVLWAPYGDWGGVPHPWYFYRYDKHINLALGGGAQGATKWRQATSLDDLKEGTHYVMEDGQAVSKSTGKPLLPRIPTEMGAEEITGDGKQINLLENDNFLVRGEEVQKRAREGAQWYNFDLPNFMTYEHTIGMWGDTENFNWPAEDSPTMQTVKPHKHSIYAGKLKVARE